MTAWVWGTEGRGPQSPGARERTEDGVSLPWVIWVMLNLSAGRLSRKKCLSEGRTGGRGWRLLYGGND